MNKPRLIEIFSCLCDETRLRIVHLLTRMPLCVCHIQEILALPQVAVSKHLAYLRKHRLVESRRHEQWMIYSLPSKRPRELDLQLSCIQDCLPTHPIFRDDLRKLRAIRTDCVWVANLVRPAAASPLRISKAKHATK